MKDKPAILGGEKAFVHDVPFLKPYLPSMDTLKESIAEIMTSGMLTKGKYLQAYEERAKEYIEDPGRHVVAVSSATIGLTITLQALGITGQVLVPSFTFCASVNAIVQAGATPVFVDSCPETYNISVSDLEEKITKQTQAILAVHVFGVPADCLALEKIAKDHNIKLIFDAAHGMGSTLNNVKMGRFGDAEIFSTTPTKTLVTGEGGLVFTRDAALAQRLRTYREYGNPGDYDCTYVGTNGRLNEISCLMGIASFDLLPEHLRLRRSAANAYSEKLASVPGIRLQQIPVNIQSAYKDFSIQVDKQVFGCNRDVLQAALLAEGIPTRRYFYPVVHKMKAYQAYNALVLPVCEDIADNILCLPIYPLLAVQDIDSIVAAIIKIQRHAQRIAIYINGE